MTLSQILDRLLAAPVSRIDWKDGSAPLVCPAPMRVALMVDNKGDEFAEAWI